MNKEILGLSTKNGLVEFFNLMVANKALSEQDLIDYRAGKKVFYSTDLYIRKYIGTTLGGVFPAITENDVQVVNRCNLSKGRIPEEMNVIMSHFGIRFGEAVTDLSATPEIIDYTDLIYDVTDLVADAGRSVVASTTVPVRRIPQNFVNAEYELKCDDGLVDSGRVSELLTRSLSSYGSGSNAENKKMLAWPKLLPSGKTLRCDLKFPTYTSGYPASSYFFVEISIKGIHLGKRPGA